MIFCTKCQIVANSGKLFGATDVCNKSNPIAWSGLVVAHKLKYILNNNNGFDIFKNIFNILKEERFINNILEDLTSTNLQYLKL